MAEASSNLVIISGRSGSGKSTALHVLEDAGFYCIDNLPAGLLPQLVEQASNAEGRKLERIAVGIDARNIPADISNFHDILASLPDSVATQVVFLDADDNTLMQRFSETRRRHPLTRDKLSLPEALASERELLRSISTCAALTIDTSQLNLHDLRDLINRGVVREKGGMALLFESFGFRHGVPINADLVFDVRFLPNPHWVPALRASTGLDDDVIAFLDAEREVAVMLAELIDCLERWLPRFAGSNRSYVTVAVGCTGGQHRSVYLCERLYRHFRGHYSNVQLRHRELPGHQPERAEQQS